MALFPSLCSTPFGIGDYFAVIPRIILAVLCLCSTPFGIGDYFAAPLQPTVFSADFRLSDMHREHCGQRASVKQLEIDIFKSKTIDYIRHAVSGGRTIKIRWIFR